MSNIIVNSGRITGYIQQNESGKADSSREPGIGKDCAEGRKYKYDVAISYASEQERYVARVVEILEAENVRVFFAPNRETEFMGQNLINAFYKIYRYESRFVVCFISEDYLRKDLTVHEARTAILRNQIEGKNCVIPIVWGNARIEGLDPDIHYIRGDMLREVEVASKILQIIKRADR